MVIALSIFSPNSVNTLKIRDWNKYFYEKHILFFSSMLVLIKNCYDQIFQEQIRHDEKSGIGNFGVSRQWPVGASNDNGEHINPAHELCQIRND